MRPFRVALCALLLVAAIGSPARAGFVVTVTDNVSPLAGGGYLYQYTLAVDPTSDFAATDFSLGVATGANLSDITIPAGWDVIYTVGDPSIYWFAPVDGSADVVPGSSASFSFTSSFAPGGQSYSSLGFNYDIFDIEVAEGGTRAPTAATTAQAAPEPASLVALASGLPVLVGWMWRRRVPHPRVAQ